MAEGAVVLDFGLDLTKAVVTLARSGEHRVGDPHASLAAWGRGLVGVWEDFGSGLAATAMDPDGWGGVVVAEQSGGVDSTIRRSRLHSPAESTLTRPEPTKVATAARETANWSRRFPRSG